MNQRRYDQTAVYLVKINPKMKFGIYMAELNPDQRAFLQRNTGAVVDIVVEKTAAFYSNILVGDVIVAVDGVPVKDVAHAQQLMGSISPVTNSSELTVIRQGKEEKVVVKF